MNNSDDSLPFLSRLWLAWATFFRVLLNGLFAARVLRAANTAEPDPDPPSLPTAPPTQSPAGTEALQLLGLLQREGRLIDFLEQDIGGFSDSEVGAAARVVHEGCRKALHAHATLSTVMTGEEGAAISIAAGYDPNEVKLVGNVQGSGPFKGKLVHRGWRARNLTLPTLVDRHDPAVLAPAEVEI
jgi:hypothetical protein